MHGIQERSTSHNLDACGQGPTGTKRVKGGGFQSGRRFDPCLRGGGRGKFSAGWHWAVAGCRSRTGKATRHRYQEVCWWCVTPSAHPEVLDIQFVSPGRGVDIRQSTGWERGVWHRTVGDLGAKDDARPRKLPPSGAMEAAGILRDRLGHARARLSVFIQVWTWSSSQTTN